MNIIKRHLPTSCYSSRDMRSVDGAVLHFISAKNITPNDPFNTDTIIRIFEDYKLSAHYLIKRDGRTLKLVPGMRKAYHAGYSRMNGRDGCNNFAVGIELEGGTEWPYEDVQIVALAGLLHMLMAEHCFTVEDVWSHSRVRQDWIATYPNKAKAKNVPTKQDPGDHFPWSRLVELLGALSRG